MRIILYLIPHSFELLPSIYVVITIIESWNKMGLFKQGILLGFALVLLSQVVMAREGIETNTQNKQNSPSAKPQRDSSYIIADEIWPLLGPKADTMALYDFLQYSRQLVTQRCAGDIDCQKDTYWELMIKLERKFVLPKAIMLGEEIIRLAQAYNLIDLEGRMWGTISTCYHAMGNRLQSIQALDSAIVLYKRTNNISGVIQAKVTLLEFSLDFRNGEDILKEMAQLIEAI